MRHPEPDLDHPQVRRVLDFDQPLGLLLVAVLHFLVNDGEDCDAEAV